MNFYKIFIMMILILSTSLSQNYKKVKIYLNDQHNITTLTEAGIALDHFEIGKDKSLITFLSNKEFSILQSTGIQNEVLIEDWFRYYDNLQKLSVAEIQEITETSKNKFGVTGFHLGSMGGYMTLAEVITELDTLKKMFPALITSKQSLGNTIENRTVYMVKISDNPEVDEDEPELLYTALHHAREPESMMQMIYFMYYLLENYNSDPAVQYLVNNREMYFIPVVNPDGYEYNRVTNPNGGGMWRKNRRNNGGSYGVDLNRNYGPDNYWNAPNGGSSTSPSSDTYRGTAPFSEPETQIIKNFLAARKIRAALNYHTYGNFLIFPYGALSAETPDSLTFREFAYDMTRYNNYLVGNDMQTVGYSTRGNSDDYFYDGDTISNGGKIFTMTPEVGNSSDGFWPPQSRIFPLAQENVYPNLYYAWAAGEYISLDNPNFEQAHFSAGDQVQLYPTFKNKGLSTGFNVHAELTSLSSYATINSGTLIIDSIKSRSTAIVSNPFSFSISSSAPIESKINLLFTTSILGAVMSQDTVSIIIGYPEFLFADTTNNPLSNWTITSTPTTPAWESTTAIFYSSPSCYTDSRIGNYANNATVTMTLTNPIDLSGYSNPKLSFWTKYDIESGWDYGQVEISTNNGNSWTPLAGSFTIPGTGSFQPIGQPVYNGALLSWEREEISLRVYNSNQVKVRFKLKTDNAVQRDGWYLDDIGIIVYKAVPVELISFSGKVDANTVKLTWLTVTELNNYGFEVERASRQVGTAPIQSWEKIGFVPGMGNSISPINYSFVDNENQITGKYRYRLKQIDIDGTYSYSNEVEVQILPGIFSLEQNFPNPFNPSTVIKYNVPDVISTEGRNPFITLKVYDVLGSEVSTLVNEYSPAGSYEIEFSAANELASGIYYYRLKSGNFVATKKMILMR